MRPIYFSNDLGGLSLAMDRAEALANEKARDHKQFVSQIAQTGASDRASTRNANVQNRQVGVDEMFRSGTLQSQEAERAMRERALQMQDALERYKVDQQVRMAEQGYGMQGMPAGVQGALIRNQLENQAMAQDEAMMAEWLNEQLSRATTPSDLQDWAKRWVPFYGGPNPNEAAVEFYDSLSDSQKALFRLENEGQPRITPRRGATRAAPPAPEVPQASAARTPNDSSAQELMQMLLGLQSQAPERLIRTPGINPRSTNSVNAGGFQVRPLR